MRFFFISGAAARGEDDGAVRAMGDITAADVVTFGESPSARIRATDVRLQDAARPAFTLTDGALRPHEHQQIKTQNRGRQHQGQSHQRNDRGAPTRSRVRQPPGQGRGQQEQQQRGQTGQLHR